MLGLNKYSYEKALSIFGIICHAISQFQEKNFLLRDLKPYDILIVQKEEECKNENEKIHIKIIDYGQSYSIEIEKDIDEFSYTIEWISDFKSKN